MSDSGDSPEETLSLGRYGSGRGAGPGRLGGFVAVLVVVLAAGLGLGFLAGHRQAPAPAPTVTVTRSSPPPTDAIDSTDPLAATGRTCARQMGRRLSLGVELTNGSGAPLTLRSVQAVTPLGGLRDEQTRVGVCTQLGALPAPDGYRVGTGATVWLVTTVGVLVRCPGPDPVQFRVEYRSKGRTSSALYPSFPDLGNVPYSGCATP